VISEVLKALVCRTITWSKTDALTLEQKRILAVIIDEIRRTPHESLYLPLPKDPRLERITQAILDNPGSIRTIDQWAAIGFMSSRTLRRLMRSETGMGFGEWRQQAQLTHALEMLARGVSVTDVADALGYASPSNFIAMFRRVFGDSPAHYFSSQLHLQPY
jgi:AraC-like DNA-binding protein